MTTVTPIQGDLISGEKMADYTSWRVGGVAEWMYFPKDKTDLITFIQQNQTVDLFWLGLGSNLLVRDGGISGVVINTRNRLKEWQFVDNNRLSVEVGVTCAKVAKIAVEYGLAGAEFLAGIPGTIGGALKMNAGAFGGETWKWVETVEMIDRNGNVTIRYPEEFQIGYRSVRGKTEEWFLSATFKFNLGLTEDSQQQIKALLAKRALTQPTNQPSCGSVFKNPPADYAARLIECCGLKGYTIGGAKVSEKHANFIVNLGTATAADIEQLIEYVQQQVALQQGVKLQTEVCKVGIK
jgi:UDP-N-acetylmuramate dehydrogenase